MLRGAKKIFSEISRVTYPPYVVLARCQFARKLVAAAFPFRLVGAVLQTLVNLFVLSVEAGILRQTLLSCLASTDVAFRCRTVQVLPVRG